MSWLQAFARARQTFIEQRRSLRENVYFQAWIQIGAGQRECTVLDVSDSGARILVSSPMSVPSEFRLLLSKDGKRWRVCELIWRSDDQIGVAYQGPVHYDGRTLN